MLTSMRLKTCVQVWHLCGAMCKRVQGHTEPGSIRCPGVGVTGNCEAADIGIENREQNSGPLHEHHVLFLHISILIILQRFHTLLTAEPALSPCHIFVFLQVDSDAVRPVSLSLFGNPTHLKAVRLNPQRSVGDSVCSGDALADPLLDSCLEPFLDHKRLPRLLNLT